MDSFYYNLDVYSFNSAVSFSLTFLIDDDILEKILVGYVSEKEI